LKRNPRFVSHFVPTSSSWMNLVESKRQGNASISGGYSVI
jgi:hypothetical protein